jgi:hypothetical protein
MVPPDAVTATHGRPATRYPSASRGAAPAAGRRRAAAARGRDRRYRSAVQCPARAGTTASAQASPVRPGARTGPGLVVHRSGNDLYYAARLRDDLAARTDLIKEAQEQGMRLVLANYGTAGAAPAAVDPAGGDAR